MADVQLSTRNASVKTAYEANADTNAFTDAEKTKLTGIETGATADQTGAEIKLAYEAEADTNAFTDAEKTKLTDTKIVLIDLIANRPAAGTANRFFWATDEQKLYFDDGVAWDLIAAGDADTLGGQAGAHYLSRANHTGTEPDAAIVQSNVTQHQAAINHDALANFANDKHRQIIIDLIANRPAAGTANRFFWATDEKKLYRDTGTVWDLVVATPDAHTATHVTGGFDKIRDATAAQDGLMTAAFAGKLESFLTPEQFGAVGDGLTNDAAAFDLAIAEAVSTGKLLRGNPSKVYYIGTSLADITGTFRFADLTLKAPNQVRLLLFNPTWDAENTSLTSLTTATIGGTTVTRVLLTSTAGLAVGDWVMVGSSTVLWPGETNVRWFESAQIVALTADTSIDLHRRLLGEEFGTLNASLRLFKIPDVRLEGARLRVIADGDVFQSAQTGRLAAVEIRGGIGHRLVNCHAESWWERFIQFRSSVKHEIDGASWDALPDIPTSNEAFGFGVQEVAACYGGLIAGIQGGRCRHGYTSGGVNVATYDGTTPWSYGMVGNSIIKLATVHGASVVAFDTHAGTYGVTLDSLTAQDPVNQPNSSTLPAGFQNRGYRTRMLNCSSRGGDSGFRDKSALTDWGALAPNIAEYGNCRASELDQDGFLFEGVAGNTNTTVVIDGLAVANGVNGIRIDGAIPFEGSALLRGLTVAEITGHAVIDDSGDAKIRLEDLSLDYAGQASAVPPIRINAIGTGSWTIDGVRVYRFDSDAPNGLIDVNVASEFSVTLGRIVWDLGATFPILSPSSDALASIAVTFMKGSALTEPAAITGARTVTIDDFRKLLPFTGTVGANWTFNNPGAAGIVGIKNRGTAAITPVAGTGVTLEGAASIPAGKLATATYHNGGANCHIVVEA
jgi:hypothetical protein